MSEVKFPDVEVRLSGEDGNVFSIIGRVGGAIRRAHGREAADTFASEAMNAGSYDEVLQIAMRTVDVS